MSDQSVDDSDTIESLRAIICKHLGHNVSDSLDIPDSMLVNAFARDILRAYRNPLNRFGVSDKTEISPLHEALKALNAALNEFASITETSIHEIELTFASLLMQEHDLGNDMNGYRDAIAHPDYMDVIAFKEAIRRYAVCVENQIARCEGREQQGRKNWARMGAIAICEQAWSAISGVKANSTDTRSDNASGPVGVKNSGPFARFVTDVFEALGEDRISAQQARINLRSFEQN